MTKTFAHVGSAGKRLSSRVAVRLDYFFRDDVTVRYVRRRTDFLGVQFYFTDRYDGFDDDINELPDLFRANPISDLTQIPHMEAGVRGLEETRRVDLEQWMDSLGLDAVLYPAMADVGLWFAYGFYSLCALASFFFVLKFVQETKGKELEEMA